jgi:hypothetical protein
MDRSAFFMDQKIAACVGAAAGCDLLIFTSATKKPLNLSIQGLFGIAVWLHDLDSNQGPSD